MDTQKKKQKLRKKIYCPVLENEDDNQDLLKHLEGHKKKLEVDGREVISTETTYIPRTKRFMTARVCTENGNPAFLIDQLDLYTNKIKSTSIFGIQKKAIIKTDEERNKEDNQMVDDFFENAGIEINTQTDEIKVQILSHQEFDQLLKTLRNINWNDRDSNKYVF